MLAGHCCGAGGGEGCVAAAAPVYQPSVGCVGGLAGAAAGIAVAPARSNGFAVELVAVGRGVVGPGAGIDGAPGVA